MFDKPTYLIAELKGDVEPLVLEMRKRFNPGHTTWPTDITLAGSSGIGTIKEGQKLEKVIELLTPIIEEYKYINVNFLSINRFPNTGIYVLSPERERFDKLHNAISGSGIEFNSNPWPYKPHCTLRSGAESKENLDQLFDSIVLPSMTSIECFSLYQPEEYGGKRLYRF
ncbi:2'-5' RNA ligase family protein [Deefgea sp. CFH1-16]|uniref:2'-5' RNA ligase family protein n=1 Tax=Deefgea sp. CFH1-16 TaxID=2675457 RepID=UPI0015F4E1FF|nr:2'-5' RNA ligase family protein [Deefgea sp. CFH1-16]MBM5575775.1 hypothetical protein [Deefgea sp. CFH1-16]